MTEKMNAAGAVKAALLVLLAAAAVLALLILVPSSPALLVDEPVVLKEIDTGFINEWDEPVLLLVTGYSVCMAVGAALAMLLTALVNRLRGGKLTEGLSLALMSGAFALVGSRLLYCVLCWSYIMNDLGGTWAFPVQLWQGGYTMYGAILGGLLGAFLWAKASGKCVLKTMDTLIPGMLLLIAAGRAGEYFSVQGGGNDRATEALAMLPLTKADYWGDPVLAVCGYAVIVALIALVVSGVLLLRRTPAGRAAENGLIIVSAWQILLESLRGDELIKFGFVRLNMIAAAVVLAAIITGRIIRCVKKGGWTAWQIARIVLLLAGAGVVIAIEFALDGKIKLPGVNNTMLYAVDALAVTGMMLSVLIADGREKEVR